jgi:mannose-1-phosphate guanylyltransferase
MKNAGDRMSDPFFLLNSDVIADADLAEMSAAHRQSPRLGTMALAEVEDTRPYGVAALGPGDRITAFVEKPEPERAPSHWINAGLAVWGASVLDRIPPGRPVSFEQEVVPGLLADGLYGFRLPGFWDDAGTRERLLRSQRFLFDAGRAPSTDHAAGATLHGQVAVLEGASVAGATLGPYVTIGHGARVERGAHVEDAIVMDGAVVGAGARVLRSIVGPGETVEPGRHVVDALVGTTPA